MFDRWGDELRTALRRCQRVWCNLRFRGGLWKLLPELRRKIRKESKKCPTNF